MERLAGIDAAFLYAESPPMLLHTLKVLIVDRAGNEAFSAFRELLENRVRRLPALASRVESVPLSIHHPVWQRADVDIDAHLTRNRLPSPGTRAQMDQAIAAFAGMGLRRDRPLWEIRWFDGLADSRSAVALKIHHALADGSVAVHLISELLSDAPLPAEERSYRPHSTGALLAAAARDRLSRWLELPDLMRQTATGAIRWLRRAEPQRARPILPILDVPPAPFSRPLRAERSFATGAISLSSAREAHSLLQVPLNDIVLAVVATTLRQYLGERGLLPSRGLIASVPTSSESSMSDRTVGNRLSNLFVNLATELDDPLERVRAIHASSDYAKRAQRMFGPTLMEAWAEQAFPLPYRLGRLWSSPFVADRLPPPVNLIVSNVRGPTEQLSAAGLPVSEIYSVGPILHGVGLNLTFWSYRDSLGVGVLSSRGLVDQPELLTRAMPAALDEILSRAQSLRRTQVELQH